MRSVMMAFVLPTLLILTACTSKTASFPQATTKRQSKGVSPSNSAAFATLDKNWTQVTSTNFGQLYSTKDGTKAKLFPSLMLMTIEVRNTDTDATKLLETGKSWQERCMKTKKAILAAGSNDAAHAARNAALQTTQVSVRLIGNKSAIIQNAQDALDSRKMKQSLEFPEFTVQVLQMPNLSLNSLTATAAPSSCEAQTYQNKILKAADGASVNMSVAEMCDIVDTEFRLQGLYQEGSANFHFHMLVIEPVVNLDSPASDTMPSVQ